MILWPLYQAFLVGAEVGDLERAVADAFWGVVMVLVTLSCASLLVRWLWPHRRKQRP